MREYVWAYIHLFPLISTLQMYLESFLAVLDKHNSM